ncbi:MAG: molybdopterin dinucleotide binding domain-containing protein [Candidatus Hodarchaeota archaeon]
MKMTLNTVRMADYDQAREHAFGDDQSLKDNLAIGIINPEDFKNLNLTPSLHLKLSNEYGEVIIKIKEDKDIPQGTIIMPVSIWANQLTAVIGNEIEFKNIEVNVEATREPILNFTELISAIKG